MEKKLGPYIDNKTTKALLYNKQYLQYEVNFWATVCKTVRPMLSDRCLSVCPVLSCL